MPATRIFSNDYLSVIDYRCTAGPLDRPYVERHSSYSISYVRRGTFGYRFRGASYDLIPGSLMLGCAGDEYMCTHDHHLGGDECLSFHFTRNALEALIDGSETSLAPSKAKAYWQLGSIAPHPELMVFGELAQAAVNGDSNLGIDEIGLAFANKFVQTTSCKKRRPISVTSRDRERATSAALWLDQYSHQEIDLQGLAHRFDLSPFHFLRLFSNVTGVTPHQYLVRSRLRRAARLLAGEDRSITDIAMDVGFADLSNFVRTFHRAAGASPRDFRRAAHSHRTKSSDRNIFQEHLNSHC